jgi:hypothetical protein
VEEQLLSARTEANELQSALNRTLTSKKKEKGPPPPPAPPPAPPKAAAPKGGDADDFSSKMDARLKAMSQALAKPVDKPVDKPVEKDFRSMDERLLKVQQSGALRRGEGEVAEEESGSEFEEDDEEEDDELEGSDGEYVPTPKAQRRASKRAVEAVEAAKAASSMSFDDVEDEADEQEAAKSVARQRGRRSNIGAAAPKAGGKRAALIEEAIPEEGDAEEAKDDEAKDDEHAAKRAKKQSVAKQPRPALKPKERGGKAASSKAAPPADVPGSAARAALGAVDVNYRSSDEQQHEGVPAPSVPKGRRKLMSTTAAAASHLPASEGVTADAPMEIS